MRLLFNIIMILLSAQVLHSSADRTLSMLSNPVNIEHKIWDFSRIEETKNGPRYRIYGDTLISEIFNDSRQWYSLIKDTTYYIGEESRYHKLISAYPIPTFAFLRAYSISGEYDEASFGEFFKTFPINQHGTYASALPIKGEIILSDELSIYATAVNEIRTSKKRMTLDSLKNDELVEQKTVRTRWFIDNDTLPIALQYSKTTFFKGKKIQSDTRAYIVNFEEENIAPGFEYKLQQNLDQAVINIKNGIVEINGTFPESTILNLYISDIAGKFIIPTVPPTKK